MKQSISTLLLFLLVALLSNDALSSTAQQPVAFRTETSVNRCGYGKPKPKKDDKKGGEKNRDVFGGRGKKITVREDEDNAMWIEDDDGKRKKAN